MGGRIEGEGPRGEPTSQQSKPEQTQPLQGRAEGGNAVPGILPTLNERAKPPPESQERQPLPSALDILKRRAQLMEDHWARGEAWEWSLQEKRAFNKKYAEAQRQQGYELWSLYRQGTGRDKLIIDVYTTMAKTSSDSWTEGNRYIPPQKTRDLIARVASMTEDELREELRKAQEALEKKTQAQRKRQKTRLLYKKLTPEERDQRQLETQREYGRNYKKANREKVNARVRRRRQERKEQGLLPPKKQRPKQISPPPSQE